MQRIHIAYSRALCSKHAYLNHNCTERAVVALLHGFYLAFTKSFASLVSRVVDKPNTQLKSDANDFVNAKNHSGERNLCSQVSTKLTAVEEHQGN